MANRKTGTGSDQPQMKLLLLLKGMYHLWHAQPHNQSEVDWLYQFSTCPFSMTSAMWFCSSSHWRHRTYFFTPSIFKPNLQTHPWVSPKRWGLDHKRPCKFPLALSYTSETVLRTYQNSLLEGESRETAIINVAEVSLNYPIANWPPDKSASPPKTLTHMSESSHDQPKPTFRNLQSAKSQTWVSPAQSSTATYLTTPDVWAIDLTVDLD